MRKHTLHLKSTFPQACETGWYYVDSIKEMGYHIPRELPRKTLLKPSTQTLMERRVKLEAYCDGLLKTYGPFHEDFWFNRIVKEFFNIPDHRIELNSSISHGNWITEFRKLERKRDKIGENVSEAYALTSQAKSLFTEVTVKVDQLKKSLDSTDANITKDELSRRQDKLHELNYEIEKLGKIVLHTKPIPPTFDGIQSKVAFSATSASPRRVFGVAQETNETKNYDDSGLVQLQRQMMVKQDENLDQLLSIVQKQKEIGSSIGQELDIQNKMLSNLEIGVDKTGLKISQTQRKLKKMV
ncbi:hypothetical protein ROZALSC1DRAFT_28616 [Rozella allomycis CSF55]|uniref:t-SNARE coiled-coil homology domain-containing protein n=1 Tax=Rozella allomycis (strain CSF55) TaxID=988480 RepID=A0A075AYT5_ROZAC|nr:hypothetical protein O9G_003985 [Rozella allomycis CSF55]RKP19827.1 hypothetical protein ROZALSC1DRAFT_28616 [Rozella allomycis CSF55]|eukprot:EPZ33877.1 hypothetical protein O9G_003985 [Rozella allomycis CSF55]